MDPAVVAQDIMKLGARPWAAAIAAQVYMDLCEVKRLAEVEYSYEKSLDLLVILGKNSLSDEDPTVYIPVLSFASVSDRWIFKVLAALGQDGKQKRFILAIRQEDTTIAYYTLTDGLALPESPEIHKQKKNIEDRLKAHDSVIYKRKRELFELAKNSAEQKQKMPHSEKIETLQESHKNNESEVLEMETCIIESVNKMEDDAKTTSDQASSKESDNVPSNDKEVVTVNNIVDTSEKGSLEQHTDGDTSEKNSLEQHTDEEKLTVNENKKDNTAELENQM